MKNKQEGLLICDFGSQYTFLIARRLRELGFYCEIIDGASKTIPATFTIKGIILSGGPDSVSQEGARTLSEAVLGCYVPILGICYGMQLLVHAHGGKVEESTHREYGKETILWDQNPQQPTYLKTLLKDLPHEDTVWMSHGDTATSLGPKFKTVATTASNKSIAAIFHTEQPVFGLQFHPEVHHSPFGFKLLENFAQGVCHMSKNWDMGHMLESCIKMVQDTVPANGKVLLGVSGGVDSTVASVVIAKALGPERLTCVLTDHGMMRLNEVEEVRTFFKSLNLNLVVLDKADTFLERLKGQKDPETKRKIIGSSFIESFEEYAKKVKDQFTHLGQGTLYPDVIESAAHGSGSKVIKSHHNVGGLPERLSLKLVEPFRYLFKDEVRKIGELLNLPDHLIHRHPFPGPGLGVRLPGLVTRKKLDILRQADHIFISSLKKAGLYNSVWQAGVVLLPVKTVGVMGDNRTYEYACSLRAVEASDGMTAKASPLTVEFLSNVADQIVRKVKGINRVLYDVTSKPPATIEWE